MGQLATIIHDAAAARIPAAPVTDPAALLTGPELLAIFATVEAAVAALEARAAGSQILANTGPPSNSDGNDHDLYVNTANGDLWGKAAGAWTFLLSLRGPQGLQGATGATGAPGVGTRGAPGATGANGTNGTNGANGRDGSRIYADSSAPGVATPGSVGDLYFHLQSASAYAMYDYPSALVAAGANPWRLRFQTPDGSPGGSPAGAGIDVTQFASADRAAVGNDANWDAYGHYTPGPLSTTGPYRFFVKLPTPSSYGYEYRTVPDASGNTIVYRIKLS